MYQLIDSLPWVLLGSGSFFLAIASLITKFPLPFRNSIFAFLTALSAFSFGVVEGKKATKIELKREIKKLENVIEANKEIFQRLSLESQNRFNERQRIKNIISQYEREIENGKANSCNSDPAYSERLRSILKKF